MLHKTKTDKELAVLLTKNDETAFREFYFRYKDKLWHYAFSFLKSKEESDDIVQEIFIRFWELRNFIDTKLSVSSLLYTMVRNRVLNHFRDMDIELQLKRALLLKHPVNDDSTEANLIFTEYQKILTEAIEHLPTQRKRIFNLSRMENKSHKEIAALLGISVSTVQEHISEALKFIKIYLSKHADLTLSVVTLACLY